MRDNLRSTRFHLVNLAAPVQIPNQNYKGGPIENCNDRNWLRRACFRHLPI